MMESSVLDDGNNSTLGLNIVAVPAEASSESALRAHKRRPTKKRNNKYEKRRRKAQQAREQKQQQQQQQQRRNKNKNNSGDNTQQLPVNQKGSALNALSERSEEEEGRNNSLKDSSLHDKDDELQQSDQAEEEEESEEESSNVSPPTIMNIDSEDDEDDDDEDDDDDTDVISLPLEVERRSENCYLPDNEEERAKYLAEFHARPLELDRRAGAVVQSNKIADSKDSSHLFSETMEWENLGGGAGGVLDQRLIATVQATTTSRRNNTMMKLERPTMIQSKAIPAFFDGNQSHNLLIHSETGSGKTLAFLLPIIQSLALDKKKTQQQLRRKAQQQPRSEMGTRCIILCPTRELALQTLAVAKHVCSHSFNWLVPGCLFGEERRKSEKARIRKGLAIVVATPGRLLDHLIRTESLLMALKGKLEWVVLDEADRLLDMGLGEQVKQIMQRIRANQPGSGQEGITWRSVLVSATVTPSVEKLAKETLMGGDNSWKWVKGGKKKEIPAEESSSSAEFAESTPRQLSQLHMTVSAKLRLPALVAFLVQRAQRGERTVVFVSTCAAVDYYHALLEAMDSILQDDDQNESGTLGTGLFGSQCRVYKLHGSIPHGERQLILRQFAKNRHHSLENKQQQAAVLFATDVAARGLNLPDVDWTVQYDPPAEVADYVHRAGRVARAGRAGHSLLFLLPSERPFLDILKKRGVKNLSALSLACTLNGAAAICPSVAKQGFQRSGGGLGGGGREASSTSRSGEAFCAEVQRRLEDCVAADDAQAKTQRFRERRRNKNEQPVQMGALMELAQAAFLSHLRSYPTKEKLVRHIFSARALHLGHMARSFALKEPPKKLATTTRKNNNTNGGRSGRKRDLEVDADSKRKRRKSAMAFEPLVVPGEEQHTVGSKKLPFRKAYHDSEGGYSSKHNPQKAREILLSNAARLQRNGLDSL